MINNKNIIIGALVAVILIMAVGYSAFATQLTLNGTAEITGEWDVRITKIEIQDVSEGSNGGEPQFTNTTATFQAELTKPGDKVTYLITVENAGTIDATLNNVIFTSDEENGSPAIKYTTSELAHTLTAGEQASFTITVEYDSKTTEMPSVKTKTLTGVIEYVQK